MSDCKKNFSVAVKISLFLLFGSGIRGPGSVMDRNQDPGNGIIIPDSQHYCQVFTEAKLSTILLRFLAKNIKYRPSHYEICRLQKQINFVFSFSEAGLRIYRFKHVKKCNLLNLIKLSIKTRDTYGTSFIPS
jgi:hypothetical protein